MELETSPAVYNTFGVVMTVTTLFSFIFNACGLLTFFKNKNLVSPTNMFIIALCACDLFMCVPSAVAVIVCFQHWNNFNVHLCVFEGFLTYLFGLTSIYLLAAISLDRYIIITKPILAAKIGKRATFFCIMVCFFLALGLSIAPLVGWNTYTFEGIGISCSITWQSDDANALSFVIFIFFVCFILPVTVMIFSYSTIYFMIYRVNRTNTWGTTSRIHEKNMAMEKKMIFTCVVLVFVFVLLWTPYAIVSFMSAFGFSHLITPIVATIPAVIAKTSGIWNPMVYLATNKQFRNSLYRIVPCNSVAKRLRNIEKENEAKADVTNMNSVNASTTRYPGSQIYPTPVE